MPYAFLVTTLASNSFLLKYCYSLSIAFSFYDFNSHENLGKAESPIATNRISPMSNFPIRYYRATNNFIIYIEAAFSGYCWEFQQQYIKAVFYDLQFQDH